MPMDRDSLSMNNLASSLPAANNATSTELSAKFKEAAMSITTLYRASLAAQSRAHSAGYSAALQDVLSYVQAGLSDGSMDIGTVLDWLEARAATVQSDDEDDDHHASASAKVQLVKRITAAKENAHHHHRKATAKISSSKSPSPRPPSPLLGTKRRHAALHDQPVQLVTGSSDKAERVKRGKPKSARVPNPLPVAPAFADFSMDVEDDPRERKRVARR
ncbi:hypothetical protein AURDEDRAFT_128972 [Auricularia subglabra TFB-10046 SS5]|uniref:Uncharacterized protein n=1 Tax=Auricularia subglabra (strain TFB-10046 / SS5) TaxID=717982 RepID=J0D4T9_AURST|nr:hypothetical protein AURDEDRAFT_140614 [Auricularia subglabra TFB-10046 SS5]EJD38313.1 hypothetical protein AURDEDRAFT_128972 [Auricularia subglabra TFB-10046 SS5]